MQASILAQCSMTWKPRPGCVKFRAPRMSYISILSGNFKSGEQTIRINYIDTNTMLIKLSTDPFQFLTLYLVG